MEYSGSTLKTNTIQAATGSTINIATGTNLSGAAGSIVAPGSIIQVVNGPANAARIVSTSTSYIDTPISATITPKFATSKILVTYSTIIVCTNLHYLYLELVRNIAGGSFSAVNANEDASLLDGYTDTASFMMTGHQALDSPNTTSACIYKVQMRSAASSNSATVGRGTNSDNKNSMNITLMEIAQ